jgi:hypothetical protein
MTSSVVFPATPSLAGWRTITIALGCALVIGGIGGLIGLGGGELPLLVGLIGFTARAAVPMNQILSLITLTTAMIVRWQTGLIDRRWRSRARRYCAWNRGDDGGMVCGPPTRAYLRSSA